MPEKFFEEQPKPEGEPYQELLNKLSVGCLIITGTGTIRRLGVISFFKQPKDPKRIIFKFERITADNKRKTEFLGIERLSQSYDAGHILEIIPPGEEADRIWKEKLEKAEQRELKEVPERIKELFEERYGEFVIEDRTNQTDYELKKIVHHPEFGGGGKLVLKEKGGKGEEREVNFKDFLESLEGGRYFIRNLGG